MNSVGTLDSLGSSVGVGFFSIGIVSISVFGSVGVFSGLSKPGPGVKLCRNHGLALHCVKKNMIWGRGVYWLVSSLTLSSWG
jgi:hypothetical protein